MTHAEIRATLALAATLLERGQTAPARAVLMQLVPVAIPRPELLAACALARRSGQPDLALRWLAPVVLEGIAEPNEVLEYASCLVAIGALDEGARRLDALPRERQPDVHLFRAFARLPRWEFAAAIEDLRRYLGSEGLPPHQRAIGGINLASCLVQEERLAEAEPVLRETLAAAKEKGSRWLQGLGQQLCALAAIRAKRWTVADKALDEASRHLGHNPELSLIFVRKWRAILDVARSRGEKESLAFLSQVQNELRARRHWESLRDCDRYQALATGDRALFERVYFGTPSLAFRARWQREFGATDIPAEYEWQLGLGRRPRKVLDPREMPILVRATFAALTRDFYQPPAVGALHEALHPGRPYHPLTSPEAVFECVGTLRRHFTSKRLPLTVLPEERAFQLAALKSCCIRIVPGPRELPAAA